MQAAQSRQPCRRPSACIVLPAVVLCLVYANYSSTVAEALLEYRTGPLAASSRAASSSRNGPYTPWVTVVMPCFGQEEFIAAAIQTVLEQTMTEWELLVLDDGSPGYTCAKAAQAFLEQENVDSNKYTVIEKKNSGLSDTRNVGIARARGSFICPLDADDAIRPEYFALAREVAAKNTSVNLIYGRQLIVNVDSKNRPTRGRFTWTPHGLTKLKKALAKGPLPVMTLFTKDLWSRTGGYSVDMIYGNEDFSFWLSCLEHGAVEFQLDAEVSQYHARPGSMLRRMFAKWRAKLSTSFVRSQHPFLYPQLDVCVAMENIFRYINPTAVGAFPPNSASCAQPVWRALFHLGRSELPAARKAIGVRPPRCAADYQFDIVRGILDRVEADDAFRLALPDCIENINNTCSAFLDQCQGCRYPAAKMLQNPATRAKFVEQGTAVIDRVGRTCQPVKVQKTRGSPDRHQGSRRHLAQRREYRSPERDCA